MFHHRSSLFAFNCFHVFTFDASISSIRMFSIGFIQLFMGIQPTPADWNHVEPQQIRWWSFAIDFYVVKFTPSSTQPSTLVPGWFNQLNPNRSEGRWKSSSPSGHFWPPASRSQHPRLIKSVSRWLPLIKSTEAPHLDVDLLNVSRMFGGNV